MTGTIIFDFCLPNMAFRAPRRDSRRRVEGKNRLFAGRAHLHKIGARQRAGPHRVACLHLVAVFVLPNSGPARWSSLAERHSGRRTPDGATLRLVRRCSSPLWATFACCHWRWPWATGERLRAQQRVRPTEAEAEAEAAAQPNGAHESPSGGEPSGATRNQRVQHETNRVFEINFYFLDKVLSRSVSMQNGLKANRFNYNMIAEAAI